MERSYLLYYLGGLILVGVLICEGRRPRLSKHALHCVHENKTYTAGQRFRPDPCSLCVCPRKGGLVKCTIQDCFVDPNCVDYRRRPRQCCGVCKEYGCRHSDGELYRAGTKVSVTACERCRCPKGGGRMICRKKACAPLNCVDPVFPEGKCCGTCPNGANCWMGERTIPAGVVVYINRCKRCTCPKVTSSNWHQDSPGKSVQAVCTVDNC